VRFTFLSSFIYNYNFKIILKFKITYVKFVCKLTKLAFLFVAFVFIPDASVGAPTEASESFICVFYLQANS